MKIGLIGLDLNSGNKGCEALAYGFLEILNAIANKKGMTFDIYIIKKLPFKVLLKNNFSIKKTKKIYISKKEYNCLNIDVIFLMHSSNKTFFNHKLKECNYIIDFTGGDSFSDIYGKKRFFDRTLLKKKIIDQNIPLILGSQTIGPFKSEEVRELASYVIKKSTEIFVRDELSYNYTFDLCSRKPILVTDVAFALPYKSGLVGDPHKIKIGFNPSGLLWNGGYSGNNQFGLKFDYKQFCFNLLDILTADNRYEVHLVVHSFENNELNISDNDLVPAKILHEKYPKTVLSPLFDSCMDAKNYISSLDFMIAARMHACIGSFSSMVPVIPISYSRKFEGLFNSLNYSYLIDAKEMSLEDSISNILEWIDKRDIVQSDMKRGQLVIEEKLALFEKELEKIFF